MRKVVLTLSYRSVAGCLLVLTLVLRYALFSSVKIDLGLGDVLIWQIPGAAHGSGHGCASLVARNTFH